MSFRTLHQRGQQQQEIASQLLRYLAKDIWEVLTQYNKVNSLNPCQIHLKYLSKQCRKCKLIIDAFHNLNESNQERGVEYVQNDANDKGKRDNQEQRKKTKPPQQQSFNLFKHSPFTSTNYNKYGPFVSIINPSRASCINPILHQNILNSRYWNHRLQNNVLTLDDLLQQISIRCEHADPWTVGAHNTPSTMFCCLLKLINLQPTQHDIKKMISASDDTFTDEKKGKNQFIRLAGFLFIRYMSKPEHLWPRLEPYLLQMRMVSPGIDKKSHHSQMSVGQFVEKLLTEMNYQGTFLPRLPIIIQRALKKQALIYSKKRERKMKNYSKIAKGEQQGYFAFDRGVECYGLSKQDKQWHRCVIRERITNQQVIQGVRVRFETGEKERGMILKLIDDREAQDIDDEREAVFLGGNQYVDLANLIPLTDLQEHDKSDQYNKFSSYRRERSRSKEKDDIAKYERRLKEELHQNLDQSYLDRKIKMIEKNIATQDTYNNITKSQISLAVPLSTTNATTSNPGRRQQHHRQNIEDTKRRVVITDKATMQQSKKEKRVVKKDDEKFKKILEQYGN